MRGIISGKHFRRPDCLQAARRRCARNIPGVRNTHRSPTSRKDPSKRPNSYPAYIWMTYSDTPLDIIRSSRSIDALSATLIINTNTCARDAPHLYGAVRRERQPFVNLDKTKVLALSNSLSSPRLADSSKCCRALEKNYEAEALIRLRLRGRGGV